MTVQILKTQADRLSVELGISFADAVERHRQALLEHRFSKPAQHALRAILPTAARPAVAATPPIKDKKGKIIRPGKPGRKAVEARPGRRATPASPGTPRPTAHPLIEHCLVRVQTEGKPDDFVADYAIVDDTETGLPLRQRKDRLLQLVGQQEDEILVGIWPRGKRRADQLQYQQARQRVTDPKTGKFKPEAEWNEDDKRFLTDYDEKLKKFLVIQEKAALLQSQIEDLTEETIGNWSGKLEA